MVTHGASEALVQAFGDKVAAHTGMRFERDRQSELVRAVDAFGLHSTELESWLSRPWTPTDVQTVASQLCVGETYFFREPAAFTVLEHELLPPLIEQRRTTTRHLRVWSAGCATGEETYSLAIVISRLVPDHADWDITILGTDIHPGFLARAKEGVYGDWSFRGVPQSVRERYFDVVGERRFAVKSAQKSLTRFCYANLAQAEATTAEADLILCRNVLIYFGREHALATVQRLRSSMADRGVLLVAPTEAVGGQGLFEGFAEARFDGGLFFRKQAVNLQPPRADALTQRKVWPVDAIKTVTSTASADDHRLSESRWRESRSRESRLREALMQCEAALRHDKCDAFLHLHHAVLLEESHHPDKAREALRRALFLEPELVAARSFLERLTRQIEDMSPRRAPRPGRHDRGAVA